MLDEETSVSDEQSQDEPDVDSELSPELANDEGLSDSQSADGLPETDPYEKRFKDTQSELTKVNQERAKVDGAFAQYGGLDGALQALNWARSNPDVQAIVNKTTAAPEYDQETRDALKTVEDGVVNPRIAPLMDRIQRLEASQQTGKIREITLRMDKDHPQWQDCKEEIMQMAKGLDPNADISYETLQSFYFSALMQRGQFEDYVSKAYEEKVRSKKKKSTDAPEGSVESGEKRFETAKEALVAAMKDTGISLEQR